jgi:NAD-dependent deacetylase
VTDLLEPLAKMLSEASRVVGFTGAGVSTESGIPDFRSPQGVWSRFDPTQFTFSKYVESAAVRARSWAMRRELFATPALPNPAHLALARLEQAGKALGVVTQNIDGLHQQAGSRNVVELHGSAREVMCIGHAPRDGEPEGCGFRAPLSWVLERVDAGDEDPLCPYCGGLVKSATVSFEEVLPARTVERAYDLVSQADLMIAAGSSLQVYPAANLPKLAVARGARLVIVNDEETPMDRVADLVIRGRAGEVLAPAVDLALAESEQPLAEPEQ